MDPRNRPQVGLTKGQIFTGSIGALEATVEHNWEIADLAELERAWAKLGTLEAHKKWSQDLEANVVSGTGRWSIYRVL